MYSIRDNGRNASNNIVNAGSAIIFPLIIAIVISAYFKEKVQLPLESKDAVCSDATLRDSVSNIRLDRNRMDNFEISSSDLRALQRVSDTFKDKTCIISVEGFASPGPRGEARQVDIEAAQARANFIKQLLKERGVPEMRIRAEGKGLFTASVPSPQKRVARIVL